MNTVTNQLPKPLMILIALLQGLALLYLHEAIEFEFWPQGQAHWLYALYAVAIIGPTLLLLSIDKQNITKLARFIVPFTLLAGFVAWYTGHQQIPLEHIRHYDFTNALVLTMTLASFKLLMYAQQSVETAPASYSQLFRFSWRNSLTLALSLLFTLVFWGILTLWAQLFKVIDITFFEYLFEEEWFLYPALSMAHGFGIIIFRAQYKIIDTITRIQQSLLKFLLPILIVIVVMFLIALPFTGLAPLWETGKGSMLILWLQVLTLFFLNAVYQDDASARPYPLLIHRAIYIGIALLPIYSIISAYGLWLRIEQYGWSVDRCWGILICSLVTLFSLGYLWGIARQRDNWISHLSWVNVRMGLLFMALMVLVNSPLLDFRKISVASQMARLEQGDVSYDDFDIQYFRRSLAAPGYYALMALKEDDKAVASGITVRVTAAYSEFNSELSAKEKAVYRDSVFVWPIKHVVPDDLFVELESWYEGIDWLRSQPHTSFLIAIDLNRDEQLEYLSVLVGEHTNTQVLFSRHEGVWGSHSVSYADLPKPQLFKNLLLEDQVEVRSVEWDVLYIGENKLRINAD